jgi:hypothetical protein
MILTLLKYTGQIWEAFLEKLIVILFTILIILLILFGLLGLKAGIATVSFFLCVTLGIYLGAITNQYSFFIQSGFLIIKNEFLHFNEDRFRVRTIEIEKLNFRFDNSPQYGSIHLTIYSKENKKKFKIKATLEETESLLSTFKELNIRVTFSNIQTSEQRRFALKWLNNNDI